MKSKKIISYLLVVFVFALTLFALFKTNTHSFKRLSATVSPEEEKNLIIEKAKQYITDNINKYDEDSIITIRDLILNNYFTDEEKADITRDLYDENTRIFFKVNNGKIEDIYLKDELFSKLFNCYDICYINDNNYIYYNHDLYRILKVDSAGNTYIINNETKRINIDNINQILKNKYNELDKKISNSIDIISTNDVNNSQFLKIEDDILLSSPTGYKIYSVATNEIKEIDVKEADVMYIIKLLNTVNYKMGNGNKFNPYVVSE